MMDDEPGGKFWKLDNVASLRMHANNNGDGSAAAQLKRKGRAWDMMRKMGYTEGRGIGANEQGRAEPVEESSQIGRLGLGMKPESLDISEVAIKWNPGKDTAAAEANITLKFDVSEQTAEEGVAMMGPPKPPVLKRINGLAGFVDDIVLESILRLKSRLDSYDSRTVTDARSRCNPYESLKNGQYLNRAALKMANMNSMFDFSFTSEERHKGVLYFADICAGPGGFSEYILSQRPLTSCGYGFTLKGKDDFRKERIIMGPAECFIPHYGVYNDGDIYRNANIDSFADFVRKNSGQMDGLHLVTADGGFDVTGEENTQEIRSKRLYLCQCLCALKVLREDGDFICKLFDTVTLFTAELFLLMAYCFKHVYIIKPVTSRPANSERYLVGIGRRHSRIVEPVQNFLTFINESLDQTPNWEVQDVVSMLPGGTVDRYPELLTFLTSANDMLGHQQAVALSKLHQFIDDRNMIDQRQHDIRLACLQEWRLSPDPRPFVNRVDVPEEVKRLLSNASPKDLLKQWRPFREDNLPNFLKYSYKAMILASNKAPYLIYSRGQGHVYFYKNSLEQWRRMEVDVDVDNVRVSLPRNTIVLGHVVREFSPRGNKRSTYLHLLDALVIYGEDVRERNLFERHDKLRQMVQVLREPGYVPFNVPKMYRPYEPQTISKQLRTERLRGMDQLVFDMPNGNFIVPAGVWMVKITKEPWIIHMSRQKMNLYYFNTSNRASQFEPPSDALCSYSNGIDYFLHWTKNNTHDVDTVSWESFSTHIASPHQT